MARLADRRQPGPYPVAADRLVRPAGPLSDLPRPAKAAGGRVEVALVSEIVVVLLEDERVQTVSDFLDHTGARPAID